MQGLLIIFLGVLPLFGSQTSVETHLTGVYQGKTLFIQNPFDPILQTFCVEAVYVNGRKVTMNNRMSAIKLDFEEVDLYAPLSIRILQKDSCNPIVINPDAISFHSTFSFKEVALSDSAMVWETSGEKSDGLYVVEKYQSGIWIEERTVASMGRFGGADYSYFPDLDEGGNKYRIKYIFPNGNYLYSNELDFHYYPEPVTFTPKKTSTEIRLSRPAAYDIYDGGGSLILSGRGVTIDVSGLPRGDYVVYFDGKDPTLFTRE